MKLAWIVAGLSIGLIAAPEVALSQSMGGLSGKCQKLVYGGRDFTRGCNPNLLSTSYSDGRVGFYFAVSTGAAFTFSGKDLPNPTRDTDEIRIDRFILSLGIDGVPPTTTRASGKCSFSNPYKGPMTVRCSGKDAKNERFEAVFRTDGREPQTF